MRLTAHFAAKSSSLSAILRCLTFSIICARNHATLEALTADEWNIGYADITSNCALKSVAPGKHHIKPKQKVKHSEKLAEAANHTHSTSKPRDLHFLPNATNLSLPVCFTEDVSQLEQARAIDSLLASLNRCACATGRAVTVASTGRVGSGAMMSVIDTAINAANGSLRVSSVRNDRVIHSHARYSTIEKATTFKKCKEAVVYVYDDPIEVQLSLRKDVTDVAPRGDKGATVGGALKGAQKHADHLECNKNNLVFHSSARLTSELLTRDVFALRNHFDGYMQSHNFPMLSMAFSAFHSPESMRVLSTFVQTPLSAVAEGWQKADSTHNASEAHYSVKKGVEKVPRGEARLAALSPAERSSLLTALGPASQRTASFPEVCIWPAVDRKKPLAHASPNC